jgi:hypothetical protein
MATSSQGQTFNGIDGLTSISVKKTESRSEKDASKKVDVSTLAIADGGNKVYDDAPVTDIPAGGASGAHVTVSVNFCSSAAPNVGDTTTQYGATLICIDVQQDWKVGEYITGSATYVSYVP